MWVNTICQMIWRFIYHHHLTNSVVCTNWWNAATSFHTCCFLIFECLGFFNTLWSKYISIKSPTVFIVKFHCSLTLKVVVCLTIQIEQWTHTEPLWVGTGCQLPLAHVCHLLQIIQISGNSSANCMQLSIQGYSLVLIHICAHVYMQLLDERERKIF